MNRTSLHGLALLGLALLVSACATKAGLPGVERQTTTASPRIDPGKLLEWGEAIPITATEARGLLDLASPGVLASQFPQGNLEALGYAAWRKVRRPSLEDALYLPLTFVARRPDKSLERQSGALFLPAPIPGASRPLTWIVFAKGTELLSQDTPSKGKGLELPFIKALAAMGYAVWVPDYAGMGEGKGIQDYCVPESLAASCLDGLAAARAWVARSTSETGPHYSETGRLVLLGYSEGGLAAMAALDALVSGRIPAPGLRLAAAYPLAAPLNLMVGVPFMTEEAEILGHPEYQVFLVLGWARAYPALVKPEEVLRPETIRDIVPLFDGRHSADELNTLIAKAVGKRKGQVSAEDLFLPAYLEALRKDPGSLAYYRAQVAARLDTWTPPPGLKVLLAASPTDEVVRYSNSADEAAWAAAKAPGSGLRLLSLLAKDHARGAGEALLYAVLDLDRDEAHAQAGQAISP